MRPDASSPTGRLILNAAVDLFYAHGYESATLRDIADAVGLQVGSLYNHMASKQELLFSVMYGVMDDLLGQAIVVAERPGTATERLRWLIDVHIQFHAHRRREVFVGNNELRSLMPANRDKIVRLRERYERIFQDLIAAGQAEGSFALDDVKLTSYAVLAMCTGVSGWYSETGRLTVDELSALYGEMVLHMLGAPAQRSASVGD